MSLSEAGHGLRTLGTIAALCLLLVLAVLWGWSAVNDPLPTGGPETEECTQVHVADGEQVDPSRVTVSVLNASGRSGLAAQTMRDLLSYGFGEGDLGNAPSEARVPRVQVWTDDPKNPAVRLVARYVAGRDGEPARIVEREAPLIGVNVVIGDRFKSVVQGPRKLRAKTDSSFCAPPTA
jgi:hypothetical protein